MPDDTLMPDDALPMPPAGHVLAALDDFYAIYRGLLPRLTADQIYLIYRRLDRYAREVDDDSTRAPGSKELWYV